MYQATVSASFALGEEFSTMDCAVLKFEKLKKKQRRRDSFVKQRDIDQGKLVHACTSMKRRSSIHE